MMGLEPTTFCMASRRSSQLSYIREAASIASLRTVESLVDEAIRKLVVLSPNRLERDVSQVSGEAHRLERELPQRLVLHPVLARHLLHHQLRVGDDVDVVDGELDRLLEAGDK